MSKMAVVGLEKHNRLSFSYPKAAFLLEEKMATGIYIRTKKHNEINRKSHIGHKYTKKTKDKIRKRLKSFWAPRKNTLKETLIVNREYQKRYLKKCPWAKTMLNIKTRCNYNKNSQYYKKVKIYLNVEDLKFIWFRDKAYLLKRPSIDRKNSNGNYTLENCRYIELSENARLENIGVRHIRIPPTTEALKILREMLGGGR